MATPKSNPQKPKSIFDQEKYRAELSSAQLVKGICLLIMFGLACFLLGVLVGRFQPVSREPVAGVPADGTDRGPEAQISRVQPAAGSQAVSGAERETNRSSRGPATPARVSGPQGVQLSPRPNVLRVEPPEKAPDPAAPNDNSTASPGPSPQHISLPPPPPPRPTDGLSDGRADETSRVMPLIEPPGESEGTPSLETEAGEDRSVPLNTSAPSPEADAGTEGATAATAGPGASPIKPEAESAASFTVQVAAYSRRVNAERARDKIEAATAYSADFVESSSGGLVIVIVGRFPTRAEAEAARKELEEKVGFEGSFVKRR